MLALRAGTDTSCGPEFAALNQALKDKLVTESEIDAAVKRLFTARFRLGMFDPPQDVPYTRIPHSEVDSQAHRHAGSPGGAGIDRVAQERRTAYCRCNAKGKTIAVIGPNATALESLEGNYNGQPSHPVLPLDGIENRFGADSKVLYAQGSSYVAGFPVTVPRTVLRSRQRDWPEGRVLQQRRVARPTGADPGRQAGGFRLGRHLAGRSHTRQPPSACAGAAPSRFRARASTSFKYRPEHCSPCDGVDNFRLYLDDKQVLEAGRDVKQSTGHDFLHHAFRRFRAARHPPGVCPQRSHVWRRSASCVAARGGPDARSGGADRPSGRRGRGLRGPVAEPGRGRDAGAPGGLPAAATAPKSICPSCRKNCCRPWPQRASRWWWC